MGGEVAAPRTGTARVASTSRQGGCTSLLALLGATDRSVDPVDAETAADGRHADPDDRHGRHTTHLLAGAWIRISVSHRLPRRSPRSGHLGRADGPALSGTRRQVRSGTGLPTLCGGGRLPECDGHGAFEEGGVGQGTIKEVATEFLSERRIAITGVSTKPRGTGRTSCTSASGTAGIRSSRSTRTRTRSKGTPATTT